ncbi:MAG: T9SS type A sorting domain-containing protein [Bacteroidales bacterium]|nr:T9SS type A sorting domain-containing protein [Bacteroidales bacterium]
MKGKIQLFIVLFLELAVVVRAQIHRPTAWLRADSAFLSAPTWNDVSGNGLYAVPSSGFMPSEFSRMNFNKCFEISGAETFTLQLDINDSRQSDVIVVYETYDTMNENALWQVQLDTAKRIGQTTQRILNDNGQITYDTANRMKPVINYLSQSWREPEVCAPSLTLCSADSLQLNGKIAEALYFDRRISDTAVIQWISYLAVKYGVTLAQTDYLDSRRKVIWDYINYPGFCTSIAGLGRDDSVGLCQKQTYFADNQIVVGINQLAQTNEGNVSAIDDGDFILFGMDGVLSSVSEIYTQSGETYEVIGRSMVQVTGNARTYNTFVLLDTTAVQDSIEPVLLIDRSGTGEFPAAETEQMHSTGLDSLGHYIYHNIHWDTDQSGRDFFCFAVASPDTMGTPKALAVDGYNNGTTQDDMAQNDRRDAMHRVSTDPDNGTTLKNATASAPQYRLLPNPNHGDFSVEIGYPEAQDVTVTVHDSDGRLLLTMSGRRQCSYHFEGTVGTAGHYLIDIVSPSERKTLKMVVN